jgi:hypothetical protein
MNREIKFRGYDLVNKRWIYGSLIIEKSGDVAISDDFGTWYDVDPNSVGQFRWKEQTDIYDGDILSFLYNEERRMEPVQSTLLNTYVGRSCNFRASDLFDINKFKSIEVIGNIYQNPDLLK